MSLLDIRDVLDSASVIAWATAVAGLIGWLLRTVAQRRVRVKASAGIGWTHGSKGEPTDHVVHFVLFNNLAADVGIHSVTVELDKSKRGTRHFGPWLEQPPPETLRAQHSAEIVYKGSVLSALWGEPATDAADAKRRRYRISVQLGNGTITSSSWFDLPPGVEMAS